ncbi:Reverse transcriptase domain-containing protein [Aphis craccivora]|uniref:Reverse transcriptase domain-containing protein n=1 Tax=Aphis craccivora TaxID=307492 RepID=A0A6G0YU16_APHCR|nr:Reverse transcriptase domain-containing protein [Aphis craccivora]
MFVALELSSLTSELGFDGFLVFRQDRHSSNSNFSRGGGVLIAVKTHLKATDILIDNVDVEQVFVTLTLDSFIVLIGAVYLPPNAPLSVFESHTSSVEQLVSSLNPRYTLVCGDYNIPQVSCNELSVSCAPTPIVRPDAYHPPLLINLPFHFKPHNRISRAYRDFKSGNYVSMSQYLSSFNWPLTFSEYSINDAAVVFNDALLKAIGKFVPLKTFVEPKFLRWISGDLKNLILKKKHAHKKYKQTKQLPDYLLFSELRAKCKFRSRTDYRSHLKVTENSLTTSPSSFWKYVRYLRQNPTIPSTVHLGNITTNSNVESANMFSINFSSTFNPPLTISNQSSTTYDGLPFELPSDIDFSHEDVLISLNALSNTSSNGPDDISARCLFNCRNAIAFPLFLLFRRSLNEGFFPVAGKICSVTPVYKSGDPSDVKNYRPISIIPHIAKIFESLIFTRVKHSLNHIIIDEQHGFRTGKSTITSSVILVRHLIQLITGLIINELQALGIGSPLLSWLKSYLTNRKQFVKLHDSLSELIYVPSGVPQGGHLSPILFILFVNSINKWITKAKFLLFADDIKIYLKIDSPESCLILQSELDTFTTWVTRLGLSLNLGKCHVMSFNRSRSPILHPYRLCDVLINRVFVFKDLGIFYTSSLSFEHHINMIVSKALKILGFIKRVSKTFSSANCLRSLYLCLVRSILEYGVEVWHPYLAKNQLRLERVQNRYLSYVAFLLHIVHPTHDYSLVRQTLNIQTLSNRRLTDDINFVSSLLNGSLDDPTLLSSIQFRIPSYSTRNHTPLYIPSHSSNYGFNHPMHRMLRNYNNAL